eukprot:scaffold4542_cov150-Skeletonema_dohrnii-CCMP3373.AAC.7
MSAAEAEAVMMCCASCACGIAEVNNTKLMECDACDLVRYCSDKCQQDHSQQHETVCKERAAELRDEILFRQPEGTHRGDCPICCLPFSIDMKNSTKSALYTCCSTDVYTPIRNARVKNSLNKRARFVGIRCQKHRKRAT